MSTQMPPLTPEQLNYSQSAQWRQLIRQELSDLRCATIAFLTEDMDVDAQTVTVQVAIQERVRTSAGAKWWDIPPIINVPVLVPRGGGWSLTLPLKKNDEGTLIFCDTCFDNWWVNGRNNAPKADNTSTASGSQQQLEVRRHYHHDCGFLPSSWSQPNKLSGYSADAMQLRSDDGATSIELSASALTLKGTKLIVNTTGDVQVTAGGNVTIQGKDWLTHQHTGVATGGSNTGPVL